MLENKCFHWNPPRTSTIETHSIGGSNAQARVTQFEIEGSVAPRRHIAVRTKIGYETSGYQPRVHKARIIQIVIPRDEYCCCHYYFFFFFVFDGR